METPDASATAPDSPASLPFTIRRLIRGAARAALGTVLAGEARPYVSLVTVASDFDGRPLLLLSRLADHTRNLDADPRVSLLFDGTDGYANPQQGPRLSLLGRVERCHEASVRRRFLARHPAAALYADFGDFAFHRVSLERAHFVGGFARAFWVEEGLAIDAALAADFAAAEADILAHVNDQHADAVTLLANRLLRRPETGWRLVAIDADGCDLGLGDTVLRLPFAAPLTAVAECRTVLAALAEQARQHP